MAAAASGRRRLDASPPTRGTVWARARVQVRKEAEAEAEAAGRGGGGNLLDYNNMHRRRSSTTPWLTRRVCFAPRRDCPRPPLQAAAATTPSRRRRTSNTSGGGGEDNGGVGGGGGYEQDYRGMESDLANGGGYYTDGADRAARTSMKRGSWEGQRAQVNPYNNIMGYTPSTSGGGGGGGGMQQQQQQQQQQRMMSKVSSISEEYDRCSGVEYPHHHLHLHQNINHPGAAAGLPTTQVPFANRQPRVLLVDDDRLVRMVLGALLRRLGAVCETACHGIDAIDKVRSSTPIPGAPDGAPFDLVIMDVRMPQMNGVEATRILRSGGCSMPIVGLTANTLPEDTASFLKSGATEVLYKPMSAESAGMLLRRYSPRAAAAAAASGGGGVHGVDAYPQQQQQ